MWIDTNYTRYIFKDEKNASNTRILDCIIQKYYNLSTTIRMRPCDGNIYTYHDKIITYHGNAIII